MSHLNFARSKQCSLGTTRRKCCQCGQLDPPRRNAVQARTLLRATGRSGLQPGFAVTSLSRRALSINGLGEAVNRGNPETSIRTPCIIDRAGCPYAPGRGGAIRSPPQPSPRSYLAGGGRQMSRPLSGYKYPGLGEAVRTLQPMSPKRPPHGRSPYSESTREFNPFAWAPTRAGGFYLQAAP